ncbi:MAG: hypothetical protein HC910_04015 [Spirulinaceae cyanobacterium SM2_1_0]|nr:hypothetical protein [Spirulinaceae cyanobacterium SM2_1_0]
MTGAHLAHTADGGHEGVEFGEEGADVAGGVVLFLGGDFRLDAAVVGAVFWLDEALEGGVEFAAPAFEELLVGFAPEAAIARVFFLKQLDLAEQVAEGADFFGGNGGDEMIFEGGVG